MNNFICFVIFLTLYSGCSQSEEVHEDVFIITYEANTRGSSYSCVLTKTGIEVSTQGADSTRISKEMKKEDWQSLIRLVNDLNLDDLENFINLSNNFVLDKSRIAQLSISRNKTRYQSTSFDEGNPPDEIVELLNKILSLTETVE